jgi:hypothetical protein
MKNEELKIEQPVTFFIFNYLEEGKGNALVIHLGYVWKHMMWD